MASPQSTIVRSFPLHWPLSSLPRSPYPTMAVSATASYSLFSAEADDSDGDVPNVTSAPSLEIIGSRRALLARFSSLKQPYRPFPIIGWNRHVETIFAALFRSLPDVRLRRECLRARDNGAIALDWVSGDDRLLPPDSPALILLPGLTGGSQDTYVRHMLARARKKGWRVVVFNSRGCAHSPVTTPQFYSASYTEDLGEVVKYVSTCYPKCRLYAVGWSLGANILVRYLGQAANDPIAPSRGIPRQEIKENPSCLLIVTPKGGHLGWIAGKEAPFGAPWTDSVVMEFLDYLHSDKHGMSSCPQTG